MGFFLFRSCCTYDEDKDLGQYVAQASETDCTSNEDGNQHEVVHKKLYTLPDSSGDVHVAAASSIPSVHVI